MPRKQEHCLKEEGRHVNTQEGISSPAGDQVPSHSPHTYIHTYIHTHTHTHT